MILIDNFQNIIYLLLLMKWIIIIVIIMVLFLYNNDMFNVKEPSLGHVNELYDLLQLIVCELDKSNIEYFMIGGTLLGSVRHGGLIPWDDDADLAVLNTTPKQIIDIMKPLEKYNIIAYEKFKGNLVVVKFKNSDASIDLFMMKKTKNSNVEKERYRFLFPYNIQYRNEWFYENELFPLKPYKFGPLLLNGPNDHQNYLDRAYNNWKTVADKWNSNWFSREKIHTNTFEPKLPDNNFTIKKCII